MPIKITFIGAGRMASAIVQGLLEKGHYDPEEIVYFVVTIPRVPHSPKLPVFDLCPTLLPRSMKPEAVILACKPQQFTAITAELAEAARGKLILSILAGTPLLRLSEKFAHARNVVRTMPNTPGQIGAGVTAFAPLRELRERR